MWLAKSACRQRTALVYCCCLLHCSCNHQLIHIQVKVALTIERGWVLPGCVLVLHIPKSDASETCVGVGGLLKKIIRDGLCMSAQ